jgi:intracellular multiplication protein IcmC
MANCTSATWYCSLASQVDILTNIANNLIPVEKLVTGSAYLIGIGFAFKALNTLKSYGESKTMMSSNTSLKEPLTYLMVGAILLYFPTALKIFMQTSFGYENVLQYAPVNSNNAMIDILFGSGSEVGQPLSIIIQVIGVIAFVRGWILIARSSSQGQQAGGTGKGLMHIFGGILAMNVIGTLEVINNTLYGT